MRLQLLAIVMAMSFAHVAPAAADTVKASDPATLIKALQGAGYRAKLDKGDDGDPVIVTASGGNNITIVFSGCTKNTNCTYVEMVAVWKCNADMTDKCKSIVAKWNTEERFAQVTNTSAGIGLYYFLDLDAGGMSDALFIDNVKTISDAANELEKRF